MVGELRHGGYVRAVSADDEAKLERPTRAAAEETELELERPARAAGGLGAIGATMRHLRRETGLWRGGRTLLRMNQSSGFDCPGCAWPEPEHRAAFEFCENGAKAIAEEATRKRATPEVFAAHDVLALRSLSDFELGQLGRLTEPLVCNSGEPRHYRPISWEAAFALIGDELRAMQSPDEAVLYTSGRTSNEAAFLYQLFGRKLGTNNFPDCSNMCHESSGVGLGEVIGVGKGTVTLADFEHADLIFVIGQNPGTNHPRMLSTLREAARRGCHIISINPLREPGLERFTHPQKLGDMLTGGTRLTDELLQVRVGGDVALLVGIMKAVFEAEQASPGEILDHAFIDEHCTGLAALREAIVAEPWERIEVESGVSRAQLVAAGAAYVRAERVIACWAMESRSTPTAWPTYSRSST